MSILLSYCCSLSLMGLHNEAEKQPPATKLHYNALLTSCQFNHQPACQPILLPIYSYPLGFQCTKCKQPFYPAAVKSLITHHATGTFYSGGQFQQGSSMVLPAQRYQLQLQATVKVTKVHNSHQGQHMLSC